MRKLHIIIAGIVLMMLTSTSLLAQSLSAIKLNEVLVINKENFIDNYGKHSGWIEIYNSSAATVNVAGWYLTNDRNNPKKYMIPKGDVQTIIRPYQHILFWADKMPTHGTFHLNFTLDSIGDNYIGLYNPDGRTLIDEVTIPAGQKADVSYGLDLDGKGSWTVLENVTPSANNVILDSDEKIENFRVNDPWGIGLSLTSMAVVFIGLILLFLLFKFIGWISINLGAKRAEKAGNRISKDRIEQTMGAEIAAIGMALHEMNEEVHDDESTILTINKVQRNYSPWSSKIHGLRQEPKRR